MRTRSRNERGAILLITLSFTVIAAIGLGAFLHLIKTQVTQARLQSCSTQAFYAAEAGLEKAIKLLKDDLYYTPETLPPSWSDDKIYNAEGYIKLLIQKYMNPQNPHYDEDFYPFVGETTYNLDANGAYKSTYQLDLANLVGWSDRIWVRSTGKYYRKNATTGSYTLKAERRILSLLRAREINPWNNAIFAGEGNAGRVINGCVEVRGSVHLLGTSLGSGDIAMDLSGGASVGNHYAGMPAALASRVPSITKDYGGEIMDSLEAEVRVQHGMVSLDGSSSLGQPNVPANGLKETVDGCYVTHGYTGNSGATNVHSDNGKQSLYDLDEFDLTFPRLSGPSPDGLQPTYMDWLKANALVISGADVSDFQNILETSAFSHGGPAEKGYIAMDGAGNLIISGIVVVEGDITFDKKGGTIEYEGKGSLVTTGSMTITANLLTRSFNTYPTQDILGVMAADSITFDTSQLNLMGVFYAENQISSTKQTSVAGTFFSDYFDMGQNVPAIYQVPEVIRNLPPGMIGDFSLWSVKPLTWGEIGPRKTGEVVS
jgi:hypothetical protein